jgi:hypothetical protein
MRPTIEASCPDCGDTGEIYTQRYNPDEYGTSGGGLEDDCIVCPCSKAAPVPLDLDVLWKRLS